MWLQNKQFVYRGHDYERIGAFTQRLQAEYVAAHILMRNTPPDDSIIANDGQCKCINFSFDIKNKQKAKI